MAKAKLILKSYKIGKNVVAIIDNFEAPKNFIYSKLQKYNEVEYSIKTSKLRMEFCLRIMEMFCRPGETIFSIFGGGKVLCAGVVSSKLVLIKIESFMAGSIYLL